MTDVNGTPLDELQWNDPAFGTPTAENVHIYFMLSPFCDPSSNNSALELQARSNPDMLALMYDRSAFEARLRSMGGLEYIIVEGPRSTTPEMNPVWVIRKQDREKSGAAGMPDSITVLGTYFCVAGNIYQAPGLKDMLSARVLSITDNLSKFYTGMAALQFYSPTYGYTYRPPRSQSSKLTSESTKPSRTGTPLISDGTAPPSAPTSNPNKPATSAVTESFLLMESLRATTAYPDEYMDTNPLVGEPGSFVFSATQGMALSQREKQQQQSQLKQAADTVMARTSVDIMENAAAVVDGKGSSSRKGSKVEKEAVGAGGMPKPKRRKSKAPLSPNV